MCHTGAVPEPSSLTRFAGGARVASGSFKQLQKWTASTGRSRSLHIFCSEQSFSQSAFRPVTSLCLLNTCIPDHSEESHAPTLKASRSEGIAYKCDKISPPSPFPMQEWQAIYHPILRPSISRGDLLTNTSSGSPGPQSCSARGMPAGGRLLGRSLCGADSTCNTAPISTHETGTLHTSLHISPLTALVARPNMAC